MPFRCRTITPVTILVTVSMLSVVAALSSVPLGFGPAKNGNSLWGPTPRVDSDFLRYVASTKQQPIFDPTYGPVVRGQKDDGQALTLVEDTALIGDLAPKQNGAVSPSTILSPLHEEVLRLMTQEAMLNERQSSTNNQSSSSEAVCQFEVAIANFLLTAGSKDAEMTLKAAKAIRRHAKDLVLREYVRRSLPTKGKDRRTRLFDDLTTPESLLKRVQAVIRVLKVSGMNGNDLAALFCHTPSLALRTQARRQPAYSHIDGNSATATLDSNQSESVEETMHRVMTSILDERLQLRRYDARKVVRSCPGLMTVKGSKAAKETVDLLCSLGVSGTSLARNKPNLPTLLSRPPSSIFRLVAFLSSADVGVPLDRIGPILRRPECDTLLNAVAPPIKVLLDEGGDVETNEVDRHYRQMKQNLRVMKEDVGIANIAAVVISNPGLLLTTDAANQFVGVKDVLQQDLDMDEDVISHILESSPQLLSASRSSLKETIDFFTYYDISLDSLQKIVRAFPSVMCLDVQKDMMPVVDFLKEIGVVNIGRFIT
jgi:hypothetical protein